MNNIQVNGYKNGTCKKCERKLSQSYIKNKKNNCGRPNCKKVQINLQPNSPKLSSEQQNDLCQQCNIFEACDIQKVLSKEIADYVKLTICYICLDRFHTSQNIYCRGCNMLFIEQQCECPKSNNNDNDKLKAQQFKSKLSEMFNDGVYLFDILKSRIDGILYNLPRLPCVRLFLTQQENQQLNIASNIISQIKPEEYDVKIMQPVFNDIEWLHHKCNDYLDGGLKIHKTAYDRFQQWAKSINENDDSDLD